MHHLRERGVGVDRPAQVLGTSTEFHDRNGLLDEVRGPGADDVDTEHPICFGMGKDPETGERLLDVMDFVKYGLPITILAWIVLWFWSVFGYWRLLSW